MTGPFVAMNAAGAYLCLPERPARHGSLADLEPLPPEWGSLDHAARFASRDAAARAAREAGVRHATVLGLEQAWLGERPAA